MCLRSADMSLRLFVSNAWILNQAISSSFTENDPKLNDTKPVNKRARVGLDFGNKTEERTERRPLTHVNRARLNDEQRQEKRMQQFKQTKRQSIGKKANMPNIKGVRLNRRFELMMQNRKIEKCGSNHGSNQASNQHI